MFPIKFFSEKRKGAGQSQSLGRSVGYEIESSRHGLAFEFLHVK